MTAHTPEQSQARKSILKCQHGHRTEEAWTYPIEGRSMYILLDLSKKDLIRRDQDGRLYFLVQTQEIMAVIPHFIILLILAIKIVLIIDHSNKITVFRTFVGPQLLKQKIIIQENLGR